MRTALARRLAGAPLSEADRADIVGSIAANTAAAYAGALARLDAWLAGSALTDDTLRDYLLHLESEGRAPATVAQAVAAAKFRARVNRRPDPAGEKTARALKRIRRQRRERGRGQAAPVSYDQVIAMQSVAAIPRPRGRGTESTATAAARGRVDAALVGLAFQAGLRRSEIAALQWRDIESAGTPGCLLIRVRAGKTDPAGERADVRMVKNGTAAALAALRDGQDGETAIFGLTARQINRRLQAAAQAAGIDGVSAHSFRVGLASELTARGASTTETMLAGGWSTARMVAHYSAGARAERGAVAKYF